MDCGDNLSCFRNSQSGITSKERRTPFGNSTVASSRPERKVSKRNDDIGSCCCNLLMKLFKSVNNSWIEIVSIDLDVITMPNLLLFLGPPEVHLISWWAILTDVRDTNLTTQDACFLQHLR